MIGAPLVNLATYNGPAAFTTISGSTLTITSDFTWDITAPGFAILNITNGNSDLLIRFNGTTYYEMSGGNFQFPGFAVLKNANSSANFPIYCVNNNAANGIGNAGAADTVAVVINSSDTVIVTATKMAMKSGVDVQLGNNATTGLIAGALAALTTASIVIKDATGQSYRVPCLV